MGKPRTTPLPKPVEHPANAWLKLDEAAAYIRISPTGLRTMIHRGAIVPDGRGARRVAMFRVGTLDRYLESRASCYTAPHAERESSLQRDIRPASRLTHGTPSQVAPSPRRGAAPQQSMRELVAAYEAPRARSLRMSAESERAVADILAMLKE